MIECKLVDCKWYKAYHILMDYFDTLDAESKAECDKRLNEIGC